MQYTKSAEMIKTIDVKLRRCILFKQGKSVTAAEIEKLKGKLTLYMYKTNKKQHIKNDNSNSSTMVCRVVS